MEERTGNERLGPTITSMGYIIRQSYTYRPSDKRRGGRSSWRERHSSGPYHQRPHRAGSGQSGLDESWAGNQDDEAVIDTTSNGDAAARQDTPNLLASAVNDMRLDEDPSASSANVSQQHPSEDSDHSDSDSYEPIQVGPSTWFFPDRCRYYPGRILNPNPSGDNLQHQSRITKDGDLHASGSNQLHEAGSESNDPPRHSDSHQVHQPDTLVHDFGYPTSSAERHLQADDQRDA